jgi:hypothetical protein
VRLGDGSQPLAAELDKKLAPIVAADRRGRVAIALSTGAPAVAVLGGAQAALRAGADTIELVVGYTQAVRAPSGDYWHGRAKDDKVVRLGVVALALEPLGAAGASTGPGHASPRAVDWDPMRATLGLHLVVGPGTWRLVAATGALAEIPAGAGSDPANGLRAALVHVRSAFPDEDGLVLVPEAGATYAQLVAAADAAAGDVEGRPLFRSLAIGAQPPVVNARGELAARVERRAAAAVIIVPDALASRAPAARQCYQDALDRSAKTSGIVAIELTQPVKSVPAGAQVKSGPADKALRSCLTQALGPSMVTANIQTARVTLSVRSH